MTVLATGELYGGARSCVKDLVALLCTQRPISGCTDNFRSSALSVRQHKYNVLSRPLTDGQSMFSLHAPASERRSGDTRALRLLRANQLSTLLACIRITLDSSLSKTLNESNYSIC